MNIKFKTNNISSKIIQFPAIAVQEDTEEERKFYLITLNLYNSHKYHIVPLNIFNKQIFKCHDYKDFLRNYDARLLGENEFVELSNIYKERD